MENLIPNFHSRCRPVAATGDVNAAKSHFIVVQKLTDNRPIYCIRLVDV